MPDAFIVLTEEPRRVGSRVLRCRILGAAIRLSGMCGWRRSPGAGMKNKNSKPHPMTRPIIRSNAIPSAQRPRAPRAQRAIDLPAKTEKSSGERNLSRIRRLRARGGVLIGMTMAMATTLASRLRFEWGAALGFKLENQVSLECTKNYYKLAIIPQRCVIMRFRYCPTKMVIRSNEQLGMLEKNKYFNWTWDVSISRDWAWHYFLTIKETWQLIYTFKIMKFCFWNIAGLLYKPKGNTLDL